MRTNRKTLRNKNKLGNIQMLNCKRILFQGLRLGLITNGGLDMQALTLKPERVGNAIQSSVHELSMKSRARLGYEPVALSAENAVKYDFK